MSTKLRSKHGGSRQGAGKPAIYGKAMIRKNVMLNPETIEILKSLGGGNLSEGIRKAAEQCSGCGKPLHAAKTSH